MSPETFYKNFLTYFFPYFRSWLKDNINVALSRSKDLDGLKEEVSKLQKSLAERLMIKEVRYDCGWNYEHYRGCLKTLERLANMHGKHMEVLKGTICVNHFDCA